MKAGNFKNYLAASAILGGTILGVGIFGLPHVFSKAGFLTGLFYLVLCCFLVTLTHLIYGEALLRTGGEHRMPGLAKIYLGKAGFYLATISVFISMSGVLLAYLILGGQFLQNFSRIINSPLNLNVAAVVFWIVGTIGMILGIRFIGLGEILGVVLIIGLIVGFFVLGAPHLNIASLPAINSSFLFLPYGILLFALSGGSAVPEIFNYFKKRGISKYELNFKKPIVWGSVIPAFLYLLFVLGVLGFFQNKIIPVDIVPDLVKSNPLLGVATDVLGMLLILTSYFIIGLGFRNVLFMDLKIKNWLSWTIPAVLPALLYFGGFQNFIGIIGFLGAGILGIETVLTIIIHSKSQKQGRLIPAFTVKIPLWGKVLLVILLLTGVALEIAKFF